MIEFQGHSIIPEKIVAVGPAKILHLEKQRHPFYANGSIATVEAYAEVKCGFEILLEGNVIKIQIPLDHDLDEAKRKAEELRTEFMGILKTTGY